MDNQDEAVTKPTSETVLDRMNAMESRLNDRITGVEASLGSRITDLEGRVGSRIDVLEENMSITLDRIERLTTRTRSEMLDFRADFKELRKQLTEHRPAIG